MSRISSSHDRRTGGLDAWMRRWACAFVALAVVTSCTGADLESVLERPRFIDVRIETYCPRPGYEPASLFVLNYSLWLRGDGSFDTDFDRDGLSDEFESDADNAARFDVDPASEDTLEDGYRDLIVASLGMVPQDQAELPPCQGKYQDADRDDLDDCEEALVGTSEYDPDFDKDRIPDGVEVRYGLNPLDIEDARLDTDQDGLSNAEEIRRNTPLNRPNGDDFDDRSISYDVTEKILDEGDCRRIDVSNVPTWDVDNGNYIRLLFLETGFSADHGTLSELRTVTLLVSRYLPEHTQVTVEEVDNQVLTVGYAEEDSRD